MEQFQLEDSDYGVRFASGKPAYFVGGQFVDSQRFRRLVYNGITQPAEVVPRTLNEFAHFPPRFWLCTEQSVNKLSWLLCVPQSMGGTSYAEH